MWLDDLKTVVDKLGFDYKMGDGRVWQDYCPRCKRVIRGLAYASAAARCRSFEGRGIEAGCTRIKNDSSARLDTMLF